MNLFLINDFSTDGALKVIKKVSKNSKMLILVTIKIKVWVVL